MRALERIVATDGYEVMLFPMEYMYISQGEGGSLSHDKAMDFLGWGSNGRVYSCPYYAPCSCHCVANFGTGNSTWQSNDLVHLPDGRLTIVTFCFDHDPFPHVVGDSLTQGDLIGHSGTAGVATGDHMHFNTAIGAYAGYELIPGTQWYQLKNSSHIYDTSYVNDTVLVEDYGYNWRTYTAPIPPTPTPTEPSGKKFPWVLYARNLRGEQ